MAKGEDVDADVDDPEDLSKQAGEDGRSDEIPPEQFQPMRSPEHREAQEMRTPRWP